MIFTHNLSSEELFILLTSRPQPSEDALREAERLVGDRMHPLDYEKIFQLSVEHRVAPCMFRNAQKIKGLSESFVLQLENVYFVVLKNNILHLSETMRLIKSFRDSNVEVIILKGSLASELLFSDLGLYPTGDIDLLIRASDIQETLSILNHLGFNESGDYKFTSTEGYYVNLHNEKYTVDVHTRLITTYFNMPEASSWEDARQFMYHNVKLTELSPEKYLLFSIFHLFAHKFKPLKFSILIAAIINCYKAELNWVKFDTLAVQYGMKRVTIITLKLLHDVMGIDVPDYYRKSNLMGGQFARGFALSLFFRNLKFYSIHMAFYIMLFAGPSAFMRLLGRAFFPNPEYLKNRYGLSEKSKLIFVYYLLNPFLMLLKRVKI